MLKLVYAVDMPFSSVREYVNSFTDKWNDLNSYILYLAYQDYDRYMDYILEDSSTTMYFLVDEERPNFIIGYGSIEDSIILNYHKSYLNTGNIGYGIRPDLRNKGYGNKILNLLLNECRKNGMKEVCVSCHKDNLASKRIIENNKGKLEKEFFDDDNGKKALKYWIKLHPRIDNRIKRLINNYV